MATDYTDRICGRLGQLDDALSRKPDYMIQVLIRIAIRFDIDLSDLPDPPVRRNRT